MAYESKINTSIHGRRLGLQNMSSAESGGNHGNTNLLAGPEDIRLGVTTAETTSTNLKSYGVSEAGAAGVYTLDPPIPGVRKVVYLGDASAYVKTANDETIVSTAGSSHTTITPSSNVGSALELIGYTTAQWLSLSPITGMTLSTST